MPSKFSSPSAVPFYFAYEYHIRWSTKFVKHRTKIRLSIWKLRIKFNDALFVEIFFWIAQEGACIFQYFFKVRVQWVALVNVVATVQYLPFHFLLPELNFYKYKCVSLLTSIRKYNLCSSKLSITNTKFLFINLATMMKIWMLMFTQQFMFTGSITYTIFARKKKDLSAGSNYNYYLLK